MDLYRYYQKEGVLEEITRISKNREISFTLPSGGYTSRPGAIQYPNDVLQMIKKGCKSIHGSVERWQNPMSVRTGMSKEEANELRIGWDLIIDIDATDAVGVEGSKLAAKRVLDLLIGYKIKPSIKFSGRRGFHIGIPFECFPQDVDFKKTKDMYPHYPRTISSFIKHKVKEILLEDLTSLKGGIGKLYPDGITGEPSPYSFVEIEDNWGARHMFRLPYSINEKSGLISIPIDDVEEFKIEDAKPQNVIANKKFLMSEGKADYLLMDALNWSSKNIPITKPIETKKEYKPYTQRIPEEKFPPCIKNILKGIKDGRKRSLFLMLNFLRKANWSQEEVVTRVEKWNNENSSPLPTSYVSGQVSHAFRGESFPPPNCSKIASFDFRVCTPDSRCSQIKNPISYPIRKKTVKKLKPAPKKKKRRRKDVEDVIL